DSNEHPAPRPNTNPQLNTSYNSPAHRLDSHRGRPDLGTAVILATAVAIATTIPRTVAVTQRHRRGIAPLGPYRIKRPQVRDNLPEQLGATHQHRITITTVDTYRHNYSALPIKAARDPHHRAIGPLNPTLQSEDTVRQRTLK